VNGNGIWAPAAARRIGFAQGRAGAVRLNDAIVIKCVVVVNNEAVVAVQHVAAVGAWGRLFPLVFVVDQDDPPTTGGSD